MLCHEILSSYYSGHFVLSVQLLNRFTSSMSSFSPLSSICISTVKVDFMKNRPTPEMLNLFINIYVFFKTYEPPHDKTNKMAVRPAKTQISLDIRPVWSESSLSAWRKLGSLATHWAHSEDSDQTGRMPRLIWVFAGRTVILLVLSRGGS